MFWAADTTRPPSGSSRLISATSVRAAVALKPMHRISLQMDQMTTEGWFRSRKTMDLKSSSHCPPASMLRWFSFCRCDPV